VWVPGKDKTDGISTLLKVPLGTLVNVKPRDAAFAVVTSTLDGRMRETKTAGSVVTTSKLFWPVVSPSSVNVRSVELEFAGT
jgi:hypothetical protein